MTDPTKHTILITGAASGFGRAIAHEAQKRGHRVIGTARDVTKGRQQNRELEENGGAWLQLDVTHPEAKDVVSKAMQDEDVTILVNNAGYGLYGVFEDMSEAEIRSQFETNVFGSIRVLQATVPYFRQKRNGTIINMGSISGLCVTTPGGIMYSASKFALEAVSDGLTLQLAPFNIRVFLVEPGFFRTNWLEGSYATPAKPMTQDYVGGPVDDFLTKYPTLHGRQPGDPEKAANIILDVATGVGLGADPRVQKCSRLPLGKDAIEHGRRYIQALTEDFDAMETMARSATFQ